MQPTTLREYIRVSKAARLLDLSAERVRQLFDAGEIPGIRDSEGQRYCHRESVKALSIRRQVHQLMTGARKTGPKGPRRRRLEFEAATA